MKKFALILLTVLNFCSLSAVKQNGQEIKFHTNAALVAFAQGNFGLIESLLKLKKEAQAAQKINGDCARRALEQQLFGTGDVEQRRCLSSRQQRHGLENLPFQRLSRSDFRYQAKTEVGEADVTIQPIRTGKSSLKRAAKLQQLRSQGKEL